MCVGHSGGGGVRWRGTLDDGRDTAAAACRVGRGAVPLVAGLTCVTLYFVFVFIMWVSPLLP